MNGQFWESESSYYLYIRRRFFMRQKEYKKELDNEMSSNFYLFDETSKKNYYIFKDTSQMFLNIQ